MASNAHLVVAASLAALVLALIRRIFTSATSQGPRAAFPPGPPTLPVLGNLHQIPLTKSFLAFAEWSHTHCAGSDGVLGLQLGPSSRAVVLNKWRHVRDLLDARGAVYSDRPYVPIVQVVNPRPELHLVFMRYGAGWRRTRRTIMEFLKDSEVEKLLPVQDAESSQLIWQLLTDNNGGGDGGGAAVKYRDHAMRCFGGVVLASVFGQREREFSADSKCGRFFAAQDEWAAVLEQGATPPFDIFPFLRYVPDALTPWKGWRKRAEELRRKQSGIYHELVSETVERVRQGKSQDCFLAWLLRDQERAKRQGKENEVYTDLELDYIGGFLMEGGSDTTAMAFLTIVLALAAHPEIQKQAQEEVDREFGPDAMPHSADGKRLPFLKACFLETLRWRPGFPTSIPHATAADDTYQGYFIPKGTTVIMNTWAIQHDPDEYDEPDEFKPSRYMDNKYGAKGSGGGGATKDDDGDDDGEDKSGGGGDGGKQMPSAQARKVTYAFGAGRRVCAGQKMAENSLMLTIAKLVWAFDMVAAAPGAGGPDTDVRTAFKDAILTGPKEFPVEFVVRGERRREVIEEEWRKADAFLSRFE